MATIQADGKPEVLPPMPDTAVETRYAEDLVKSGGYVIGGHLPSGDIDTSMYKWTGEYWELQHYKNMAADALRWLKLEQRDKANATQARMCVDTAQLELLGQPDCALPSSSSRAIIPVRGCYLEVLNDGQIAVLEPDPALGITYQVPASFDRSLADEHGRYLPLPVNPESWWGKYLERFMPDLGVRDLLQEATASSFLTICLEKGIFLVGSGANGKSTFLHVLRALHPKNAAVRVDKLDGQFAMKSIVDKTAIFASEMPKSLPAAIQEVLKAIFSRDPIEVEGKGRDPYTTTPIATFFGSLNEWFTVSGHEHGFWRKVLAIPFDVRMEEGNKERITDYHKLITEDPEEMAQVLNWILAGASRLVIRGGFPEQMPEAVVKLAEKNRLSSDTVASYLVDREVVVSQLVKTSKKAIYADYRDFVLNESGKKPVADEEFWKRARERLPGASFQHLTIAREKVRAVNLAVEGVKAVRDDRQSVGGRVAAPEAALEGVDDIPG